ncbi:hypothetical protein [Nocardioides sediminis]|uniref:hypothetical protein n=1 Tax=Nocardioides sediminis TaxID=433648 RepID=UPI00131EFB46|nr:hypothetical protein [Nocardioides sediminis]
MSVLTEAAPAAPELSAIRLHAMRGGYLVMGVGLVLVKWPLLPDAHAMPLYEGVTLSLLTAISLLAFVGVWRPIRMLPILVFEVLWKVLWLLLVAAPRAVAGELDGAFVDVAVNCSLLVVIAAAVPWGYVWHTYVRPDGR